MAEQRHEGHAGQGGHDEHHHHVHGTMDTSEQEKVFNAFIKISAWHVVLIFLILTVLAITQT